jgi:hypothetical protein
VHVFRPLTPAPPATAATKGLTPSKESVVLVTGATGWGGWHAAKAFIAAGFSVNVPPNPTPQILNLKP